MLCATDILCLTGQHKGGAMLYLDMECAARRVVHLWRLATGGLHSGIHTRTIGLLLACELGFESLAAAPWEQALDEGELYPKCLHCLQLPRSGNEHDSQMQLLMGRHELQMQLHMPCESTTADRTADPLSGHVDFIMSMKLA